MRMYNYILLRLTFIKILGCDGENRVLDIFILINFSFVVSLVKIWRIVVLVGDADTNKFGNCTKRNENKREEFVNEVVL